MKYVLIAAGVLLFLYVFFVLAPSVCSFLVVFSRRKPRFFREMDLSSSYLAPWADRLEAGCARLESLPHTEVTITAREGFPLTADYWDAGHARTVIMMHGYSTHPMNNYAILACAMLDRGFNVLIPDERGHGRSGGRSTIGMCEQYDVLGWIDWVDSRPEIRDVLVWGESMGCVAVSFASDGITSDKVRALILDCGYTSPRGEMENDMRKLHLPVRLMMPIELLMGRIVLHGDLRVPVTDSLGRCRIPALFVHGTADDTVPLSCGQVNYESCASEKVFLPVPGANHTLGLVTALDAGDPTLDTFLNTYFTEA